MKKFLVFIIYAYQREADTGQFIESTEIQVIAKNKDEAIARAKKLCPDKKHYYLKNIIENYQKNHE